MALYKRSIRLSLCLNKTSGRRIAATRCLCIDMLLIFFTARVPDDAMSIDDAAQRDSTDLGEEMSVFGSLCASNKRLAYVDMRCIIRCGRCHSLMISTVECADCDANNRFIGHVEKKKPFAILFSALQIRLLHYCICVHFTFCVGCFHSRRIAEPARWLYDHLWSLFVDDVHHFCLMNSVCIRRLDETCANCSLDIKICKEKKINGSNDNAIFVKY